jgi:hypothetical protein
MTESAHLILLAKFYLVVMCKALNCDIGAICLPHQEDPSHNGTHLKILKMESQHKIKIYVFEILNSLFFVNLKIFFL